MAHARAHSPGDWKHHLPGDGKHVLPKIPQFGPAAQLGPEVLLSKISEMGTAMPRFMSASPRTQRPWPAALPSLGGNPPRSPSAASSAGPPGAFGSARSLHAKHAGDGQLAMAKGLTSLLLRGDHTHRCYNPDSDAESAIDSEAPAADLVERMNSVQASQQKAAKPTVSVVPASADPPVAAPIPPTVLKRLKAEGKTPMAAVEIATRHASIAASFRLERPAIESAFQRLHGWQLFERDLAVDIKNPVVKQVLDSFERSGLATVPIKPRVLAHDAAKETNDPPRETRRSDDEASLPEIAGSTSILNFHRWLCGLSPVLPSPGKIRICDVISQALLPRMAVEKVGSGSGSLDDLAARLGAMVAEKSDRICILHGDASLCSAVEQSLTSTHMLCPSAKTTDPDREGLAQELVASVEERNTAPDGPGPGRAFFSARQAAEQPRPIFGISELPAPLLPLRIFWELQTKGQAQTADRRPATGARPAMGTRPAPGADACARVEGGATNMGSRQSRTPKTPRRVQPLPGRATALPDGASRSRRVSRAGYEDSHAGAYGLSSIWGDRRGALAFRRCLLNPALREFGAARRHDTCVLWTGADGQMDEPPSNKGDMTPVTPLSPFATKAIRDVAARRWSFGDAQPMNAVCFPPSGLVPLSLLQNGQTPWTIMPDVTRFQPTAGTAIRIWRVRIERPAGREWTAERLADVPVKGYSIDCSTRGDPFCIIFWPGIGKAVSGDQLEVVLSGLCGPVPELTFFYQFESFQLHALNTCIYNEASKMRSTFGDITLWGDGDLRAKELAAVVPSPPRSGSVEAEQVVIEKVSHPSASIITNVVDVSVVLRCEKVAAMKAELYVMHFGEQEEEVMHATQIQKFPNHHFFVRVKLPMARRRYELRFLINGHDDSPGVLRRHPLKYMISTSQTCQTLLSSLEDPLLSRFGYAKLSLLAQSHGIIILSPLTWRVAVGRCYFLVYVDTAVALPSARADAKAADLACEDTGDGIGATLFSQRLLGDKESCNARSTHFAGTDVFELHRKCRDALEPHTQNCGGEVHLDVSIHNGEYMHRLRERLDFPGFFEGLVSLSDADATTAVKLLIRYPRVHAAEYSRRTIGEWCVCRAEYFPINF